ncbi:hypothetical protein CHS0354_037031 [Potamilus streckersoni]|uniref:2',3'-cyclic-nucleotide 3'-phosphodiesterase n=1 Tax=Potamilus streckersoni TaxID=2493646 RepID=A0AAE0SKQ6_9BIVA|nr:hypothetical protein CHS0354_037031 [Potamilus streckersoni]
MGNCFGKKKSSQYQAVDGIYEDEINRRESLLDESEDNQPRAAEIRNVASLLGHNQQDVPDGIIAPHQPQPIQQGTLNFPFLVDARTRHWVSRSKTMFIMRGLPGSGKSTIVREIQKTYPGTGVCSADNFFIGEDGIYRFDSSLLSDAHNHCHVIAESKCKESCRVIVIDNTNIMKWEMAPYLKLAHDSYHYIPVIVEPITSWRKDPEELAKKNSHNVAINLIQHKVNKLDDQRLTPFYYGWFLNELDSEELCNKAWNYFQKIVIGNQERRAAFISWISSEENPDFNTVIESHFKPMNPIIHCTANFLGNQMHHIYHRKENVIASLGKVFSLQIISITFTPRSIGVRVKLDAEQLQLFVKPEEEVHRVDGNLERGRSAHITICVAHNEENKVTGNDILNMCDTFHNGQHTELNCSEGLLIDYGFCRYEIVLSNPLRYDTLFTGFYPRNWKR